MGVEGGGRDLGRGVGIGICWFVVFVFFFFFFLYFIFVVIIFMFHFVLRIVSRNVYGKITLPSSFPFPSPSYRRIHFSERSKKKSKNNRKI